MSIKALFDAFDKIEATSGKNDKLSQLEAIRADQNIDPLAREYFSIAMDWFRIFNVAEKTLAETTIDDIDSEVFGATPKKSARISKPTALCYWQDFLKLIARIEKGGEGKPNKEEIRNFVRGIEDEQANRWIVAALLKKPRMGCSEKTVNKVWPKLVKYFEVQLADVLDDPNMLFKDTATPLGEVLTKKQQAKLDAMPTHYWLEPKLDGIRAVCRVNPVDKTVKFLSRGGQVLNNTSPAGIDKYLLDMVKTETVFDGELFGENWNETTKVTSKGEGEADPALVAKLRFYVFDMLTAREWDDQQCDRGYEERRACIKFTPMDAEVNLANVLVQKTAAHRVESPKEIAQLYASYLLRKFEGVMVKHPQGKYEFKRSTDWLKYKPLITDEFEVVGKFEGKARSKHEGKLGGLIVKVAADELGSPVTCQVGSGFSDAQREEFWTNPPIGKLVEIEFKEKTPDGLLREPVFVRVRDDKRVED